MNESLATEKVVDTGVVGAILILALILIWHFIRKEQSTSSEHIAQIQAINAAYTAQITKINETHDLQVERLNNANLLSIEKIMNKHAEERSEWYKTSREFTEAIKGLSLAIEKRKNPVDFYNSPNT